MTVPVTTKDKYGRGAAQLGHRMRREQSSCFGGAEKHPTEFDPEACRYNEVSPQSWMASTRRRFSLQKASFGAAQGSARSDTESDRVDAGAKPGSPIAFGRSWADLARRRLREKIPELQSAMRGQVWNQPRFLKEFLEEWIALGTRIRRIKEEIDRRIWPLEKGVMLWQSVPGMDRVTACNLVPSSE
jgi:hypothetical protein